jgi:hypothetical protein
MISVTGGYLTEQNSERNNMKCKLNRWWFLPAALLAAPLVLLNLNHAAEPVKPAAASEAKPSPEVVALRAEVDRLKSLTPSQSHAMADVGYHFANCWFAAQKANWPLAQFNWEETRSHLRWAVRIIPVRKDPSGKEVRLEEILEPIEKTSLEDVGDAIKAKDGEKFTQAYKQMLESCYACHLAAGKPYLRLRIPEQPAAPIINYEPQP